MKAVGLSYHHKKELANRRAGRMTAHCRPLLAGAVEAEGVPTLRHSRQTTRKMDRKTCRRRTNTGGDSRDRARRRRTRSRRRQDWHQPCLRLSAGQLARRRHRHDALKAVHTIHMAHHLLFFLSHFQIIAKQFIFLISQAALFARPTGERENECARDQVYTVLPLCHAMAIIHARSLRLNAGFENEGLERRARSFRLLLVSLLNPAPLRPCIETLPIYRRATTTYSTHSSRTSPRTE